MTPDELADKLKPELRVRIAALRQKLNRDRVPDTPYDRVLFLSKDHGFQTGDQIFGFTVYVPTNCHVLP